MRVKTSFLRTLINDNEKVISSTIHTVRTISLHFWTSLYPNMPSIIKGFSSLNFTRDRYHPGKCGFLSTID